MQRELQKIIVGQDAVIEQIFAAIFTRGHCLLVGVPGLAKTLIVSTLAQILDLQFKRIQFTPDLMPSDITGTSVLEEDADGRRSFRFVEGPIFTNILLADEINRTPPKTQAALLQAMQEREVSAGQSTYPLPNPFFTIATQNPIEQEGTYPLPEAQQDRFMFKVLVTYPSFNEEFEVARRTTSAAMPEVEAVLSHEEILHLQDLVRSVPISDHLIRYALALVRQTRVREDAAADFAREQLAWGAGPRATQFLILGAKARALVHGRPHVALEDIRALAKPVLRHRLVVNFAAESDGITTDHIVDRLLEVTPTHEDQLLHDERFQKIFAS
jgi:MoxR-like ATPase